MKIVVLDGYTLNPGDLSWERLEALGECTIYDRTADADIIDRAAGAEVVLTNKTLLSAETIDRLADLRCICVLATGYNIVDIEAARNRGIGVSNVPAYSTESVAQLVFAHLLHLARNVGGHDRAVKEGKWSTCRDFCFWQTPLIELTGLTMGIVGMGRIGHATARIGRAFGMEVVAYDTMTPAEIPEGCEMVALADVFGRADVVSLHCPLTSDSAGIVNEQHLAMMKPTAFLINTSRGGLIDEQALAGALNSGQIAGAGLDVLSSEPPAKDNPLLTAKNCFITPHTAWATHAARQRLLDVTVENVKAFIAGNSQNVVNAVG